jgi:hypothetical protein
MKLIHLPAALLAAVFAFASLVPAARAQQAVGRVNVPFAFDCGTTHYPAGVYTIRVQDHVARIEGASHTGLVMMEVEDVSRSTSSRATFLRYGDSYFLEALSTRESGARFHFVPNRAEAEARRKAQSSKPASVQIALLTMPR